MPALPPKFVRGKGVDAVAEFKAFVVAVEKPAAHLLAELIDIQNSGAPSGIPTADGAATSVRGLYCRKLNGWAVFYTFEPKPFRIMVIYVARLSPSPFSTLEGEAADRMRRS